MNRTDITFILRTTRRAKKHRQRDIALWSGVTQSELSNIENGLVDTRFSTLKRIADALDIKIIAVPKDKLEEIDALLSSSTSIMPEEETSSLLEKYGILDDED